MADARVLFMETQSQEKWHGAYGIETSATAETVWRVFADVRGWKAWNAGIEHIELEGPFARGTEFTMKTPGQEPFRSRLLEVRENEEFVDETRVGDLVVTVSHRIDVIGPKRTKITYHLEAAGPGSAEIGPAIASDFSEVLMTLAAFAEAQPS
jgi:hypothetical protein